MPKPHTPFQWCAQDSWKPLDKQRLAQLRMPNVTYNWHEAQLSYLRRCSPGDAGGGLAGWMPGSTAGRMTAATSSGPGWTRTLRDPRPGAGRGAALSHISCGVSEAYLKREYQGP